MADLLHDLLQAAGAHKRRTRIGRGEGSKGKTSGRGAKGAGSRAGPSKRIGFEGGQTEIYRRFPKRGFSNKPFETKYHVVNLAELDRFEEGATVDKEALKAAGLIPNNHLSVKILGHGELVNKINVVAGGYSRSAYQAITAKGGTATDEKGQPFEFGEPKNARLRRKLGKRLTGLGLEDTSAAPQEQKADEPQVKTGVIDKTEKDAPTSDAPSANPTGESGDVTTAPESGAE